MARSKPTPRRKRGPLEHLFVVTDFSAGAAQAVGRAARLPLAEGARISLVHVLADDVPRKLRAAVEKAAHHELEQAAAALSKAAASAGHADIAVATRLCRGQAHVEILRHARSAGADLVVLGRHGQRTVKKMLLGSTAARVIREGDLPVLVVSRRATRSYGRPLIAVSLEDTSREVVEAALRVIGPEVRDLLLVHAYNVPFEGFVTLNASRREVSAFRTEYKKAAAADLERFRASVSDLGIRWQASIERGDARTVILSEARRRAADLICVGTHGHSGLSHAIIGSVAEWVVQAANCDVLVSRSAKVSFELP